MGVQPPAQHSRVRCKTWERKERRKQLTSSGCRAHQSQMEGDSSSNNNNIITKEKKEKKSVRRRLLHHNNVAYNFRVEWSRVVVAAAPVTNYQMGRRWRSATTGTRHTQQSRKEVVHSLRFRKDWNTILNRRPSQVLMQLRPKMKQQLNPLRASSVCDDGLQRITAPDGQSRRLF